MTRRILPAATAVLLLFAAAPVAGQVLPEQEDPLDAMSIRFGPLGLRPTLAITDIGVDTNIHSEHEHPRRDFTATFVPRLQARLRAGRMLLAGSNATGFVYYHDFPEERTVNYTSDGRAEFNLGRIQPYVSGALQDTRERLNAELDIRAPRQQRSVTTGARVIVGSRTAVNASLRRFTQRFDENATFEGIALSRTLNTDVETAESSVLIALTPLTTVGLAGAWQRDRFEIDPTRDAESYRIGPTLQFDPTALVRGSLSLGYRRFEPRSPLLPDYTGLFVHTSLGYTLRDRTRFDVQITRDVQYSFEQEEPYYLTTGGRLQVTHLLAGPFDVQASGGRERLEYRRFMPLTGRRTDTADVIGVGAGYRLRDDVRLGITFETSRRNSERRDREYERRRIFASLTYGL